MRKWKFKPSSALAVAMVVAFGATSRLALATPSARLIYVRETGAESCPGEDAVRSAVSARLGYDPFFPTAPATMFVEIDRSPKGYRAHIKLVDASNQVRGARELAHEGDRCADLVDTIALSMSVAIDPESLLRKPSPSNANDEPAPSQEEGKDSPAKLDDGSTKPSPPVVAIDASLRPVLPPSEKDSTAPPRKNEIHWALGAGAGGWIGTAPSLSVGALGFVRATKGAWSLALEGRFDAPSSDTVRDNAAVRTSLYLGSIVPCTHLNIFGLCVVGSLGSLRASSFNVTVSREDTSLYAAIGPRVEVDLVRNDSLTIWLRGEASVSLIQQTLQLDQRDVYALPAFSGGLAAGARVHLF